MKADRIPYRRRAVYVSMEYPFSDGASVRVYQVDHFVRERWSRRTYVGAVLLADDTELECGHGKPNRSAHLTAPEAAACAERTVVCVVSGWFTCPRCGRTSHHPEDVRAGYCGACHDWTGDDIVARATGVDSFPGGGVGVAGRRGGALAADRGSDLPRGSGTAGGASPRRGA